MAGTFAKRIVQARLAAGFKSAYAFYHNNGGRRHFLFTYVHYLRIEKGASLPRPRWLAGFLTALRLSPGEAGCRSLFLGYLEDLLETREACDLILDPLLCRHLEEPGFGASVPQAMKAEHTLHLTPGQFKIVAADEATYWCSEILANDGGSWTVETLAEATGLDGRAVQAGLARLVSMRLARKTRSGSYKNPKPGTYHTFPGRLEDMKGSLARIRRYWARMSARSGGEVSARVELTRAEPGFMRRYASTLSETVEAASSGGLHARGEDTSLYLVEASIRRLMPL